MKKLLKTIVSLLICGLVLLTGCGTSSISMPSELAGRSGDYPKTINILAPDFFTNTTAENTEDARQQWLDEMSERYGVKFNIFSTYNTTSKNAGSSAMTDTDNSVSSTSAPTDFSEFIGIVPVSSDYISSFRAGVKSNTYLLLDSYLANNQVWKALPEDFKSLFEVDGHIYAIPTSVSRAQYARIIHNEALQETGITVSDLASFRDFALAYLKETGKVTNNFHVPEVMDILNAFGLYPGKNIFTQFSYDPTEGCYVDWLTKGTAVEALEYLRELYNAGTLRYEGTNDTEQLFQDGFFASVYNQYDDYDTCTEVLTLNSKYPQVISTSISGFVMTKDTPQPQETINLLIDMLFGSEQSYLECWLGSSENYTLNSDGTITVKMVQNSEGNYVFPSMPNLVGELSEIFSYSNMDIIYSKNGIVDTKTDAVIKNQDRLMLLDESLKNGTVIEIPLEYQFIESATYDVNITDPTNKLNLLYNVTFTNAIVRSGFTVQELVDKYKEEMLNMGGNMMLDEMNAAIGKQTAYYYG